VHLPLQLAILFVVCMNCHGEIARTRPDDARRLTAYYLVMAAGGAVGSLLVTWCLPLISSWLVEYPLALLLAVAGMALVRAVPGAARPRAAIFAAGSLGAVLALTALPAALVRAALPANLVLLIVAVPVMLYLLGASRHLPAFGLAVLVAFTAMGWTEQSAGSGREIYRQRNYYGIYRVYESEGQRFLQHGTTSHGSQFMEGPESHSPVAYYHPEAPAPRVLSSGVVPTRTIGMIGLGTGALPYFAARGDRFTIYELDPDNLPIARRYFTYLAMAGERGVALDFVFGDGRIGLRTVAAGAYDVFVVDAFNSGSIPVHLLTREALAEYLRVLRPDGVLLLHISNRVLDLHPVVQSIARDLGAGIVFQEVGEDDAIHLAASTWAALSTSPATLDKLVRQLGWQPADPAARLRAPWTDQYSNLLSAMF
jgi:spermidine synthase